MIRLDKSRLEQVICNLLNNSIKFTKEGTISLNVEKKDNQALVIVKDTGLGIDPEILPRLFSKFATGHQNPPPSKVYATKMDQNCPIKVVHITLPIVSVIHVIQKEGAKR